LQFRWPEFRHEHQDFFDAGQHIGNHGFKVARCRSSPIPNHSPEWEERRDGCAAQPPFRPLTSLPQIPNNLEFGGGVSQRIPNERGHSAGYGDLTGFKRPADEWMRGTYFLPAGWEAARQGGEGGGVVAGRPGVLGGPPPGKGTLPGALQSTQDRQAAVRPYESESLR
jgi:hypothetical protein